MNRRILDNVSVTALSAHGDDNFTKSVCDMFGAGSLVEDPGKAPVRFNASEFGLNVTGIRKWLRSASVPDYCVYEDRYIEDSNGGVHKVTKEAFSIIRILPILAAGHNSALARCINNIVQDVDRYFKGELLRELVTTIIETSDDGIVGQSNNDNLMDVCRMEVYRLLREAGVNIE